MIRIGFNIQFSRSLSAASELSYYMCTNFYKLFMPFIRKQFIFNTSCKVCDINPKDSSWPRLALTIFLALSRENSRCTVKSKRLETREHDKILLNSKFNAQNMPEHKGKILNAISVSVVGRFATETETKPKLRFLPKLNRIFAY